jgi:hypothetical protein
MDGGLSSAVKTDRLEQLAAKAIALGIDSDALVVESNGRRVLVINIDVGTRRLGSLTVLAETPDDEERWHLEATCSVMPGLPMQADWLAVGAKRVKTAFEALVAP